MGDKGKKDKDKHNKQVNIAKNTKNEANKQRQEKTPYQRSLFRSQSRNCFEVELESGARLLVIDKDTYQVYIVITVR